MKFRYLAGTIRIARGYQTTEELMEYSRNHIEEIQQRTGKKVRKDAVLMCSTIIKPPASEMRSLSDAEQYRLLDIAIKEFSGIVRSENVKTVAIHFDEQGPHAHIFWEPITKDGRLCAKEMHNRTFFQSVNRIIPEALRKAGFDVEHCEMYDLAEKEYDQERKKNSGRTSAQFKRDMEIQKQKLASEIKEKEQELEAKKGELLKVEQVADIRPKKSFLKKDMVEMSMTDFQNLRTTAMKVDQVEEQLQKIEEFKNEKNGEKYRLLRDIVSMENRRSQLEKELPALEKRAIQAGAIVSVADKEAAQIREQARKEGKDKGEMEGYRAGFQIKEDARKQADTIIHDARKDADQIVSGAHTEATQILANAHTEACKIIDRECQHARAAVTFYDEIMSVEGEGEFAKWRSLPSFWLEVEDYVTNEVPKLTEKIEELKGILSFIPSFIVDRAKRFLEFFGHERERDDPEVSLEEGWRHDDDGLEENYYTYSRGR